MAHLTKDDKKDILKAAKESDRNFQGFTGTNRTIIDDKTYYGRSDAIKALNKDKKS